MNPRDFKPFPSFVNQRRWRVGEFSSVGNLSISAAAAISIR
jgi:hypothetical protein